MTEWIKCNDRLPEIKDIKEKYYSNDVLVLNSDGTIYVGFLTFYPIQDYRTIEEYYWQDRSTGCGCCAEKLTPTHWMPLPEKPND